MAMLQLHFHKVGSHRSMSHHVHKILTTLRMVQIHTKLTVSEEQKKINEDLII